MENSTAGRLLAIAKEILNQSPGKAKHISEIADRAFETNQTLHMSRDDFESRMALALNANAKSKSAIVMHVSNKRGGRRRGRV